MSRLDSLWARTAPPGPDCAPLDGDTETETAIVGAGFTGLSAALRLSEQGVSCCVLEANEIGYGGSGRNVGLVNAGLWLPPDRIEAALGREKGERLVSALSEAPSQVFALIDRHGIKCEATCTGTIHAAHSPAGQRELEERHAAWSALGAPVELLDRDGAASAIGTRAFHGGLLDRRAGTINPLGYARGLAHAAARADGRNAGARLFASTPVSGVSPSGTGWVVETPRGRVRAKSVLLATNAYGGGLGADAVYTPIHYFQVASAPLGEAGADIMPDRQGVWDTAPVMTSVRRDRAGRLILGSMGRLAGRLSERWADRTARRLFPALGKLEWECAWHGRIALTRDHLPRLLTPAPGLWAMMGYNGRGIGPGTVLGRWLADAALGGEPPPVPVHEAGSDRLRPLRAAAFETAFRAWLTMKSL